MTAIPPHLPARSQASVGASAAPAPAGTQGCPKVRTRSGFPDNVRVNQDCGWVQQAEEWVDVNPAATSNVVVSENEGSGTNTGYNQTAVSPSKSGGTTYYREMTPPGLNRVPNSLGGTTPYARCSDPASAHDGQGNYFYSCVGFNIPYGPESAVLVWRSNHCFQGTVLHYPADQSCSNTVLHYRPVTVVDNLSNLALFWDKELMAADRFSSSPYNGQVYVTATRFDFHCGQQHVNYCESPIWFFKSSDGGVTWSGSEISGVNSDVCAFGDAFNKKLDSSSCNFDQGSYPVVERSGAIDVTYNNCNTPTFVCQQLFVRSTDGGDTWSTPVKVADDYDLQPYNVGNTPDQYGCPPFNPCLPPNGYRLNDFPSMGVDLNTGKLAVFWADFRNGGPCATAFGLPTTPCDNENNDVFASVSTDHGATWGPTRKVSGGGLAADWQPWGDVGENGNLYVGYYTRTVGSNESTGRNDIFLASSSNNGQSWTRKRITTSSMPNMTCQDNSVECGFLGDYMSIERFGGTVYLVWGDTRPHAGTAPDSDVYFAKLSV